MTASGQSRTLPNGRSDTRLKPHKNGGITGPYVIHSREMRNSPAWRSLDGNDKLVLERIEEEHMAHGGRENGNLVVTFRQFEESGIRRAAIGRALARLEALGFVKCIERGKQSFAEYRRASRYRITYLQGNIVATHDWQAVRDADDASRRIEAALADMRKRNAHLSSRLRSIVAERRAA